MIKLIVAMDEASGIGKTGDMPWHIPAELRFVALTTKTTEDPSRLNALLMGSATYRSIPEARRPLIGRINAVLSRRGDAFPDALSFSGLDDAVSQLTSDPSVADVFIFGGADIYRQALNKLLPTELFVTVVKGHFGCDRFFPPIPSQYKKTEESATLREGGYELKRMKYARV